MLNVTETFLPPMEEYTKYLQKAFDKKWLTNRGELVVELENKLKKYLSVENLTLTTNGTLPLQLAIKALDLTGEIITTPFSYVATTSSIVWENCNPVFVDIEENFLTIDPQKIEKAITERTSAILATHVFGNPCEIEKIQQIANRHNLKVIYDAAHCFGVKYKGECVFNYGDVSTCSFHATKIFHTGEGGCFITKDKELHDKIYYHHNFGHNGSTKFHGLGINGKMSELQAALGLAVFDHIDEILNRRKTAVAYYNELLHDVSSLKLIQIRPETQWNYHYYPIVCDSEKTLLAVMENLNIEKIFPRRYFYPSLNTLPYVQESTMPISESISKRTLCLPLSANLDRSSIELIASIINKTQV
ncbi:aminotransferase class I/II-fold pyridoxal phosphate-dependent enzyme [Flavobacteriaceae bacterium Ap0902]|nr:aminotransferase class I/II-fold pyridoxal phosphate-dependent enzyme [Flavobacteriaceae bacterium Ap0902]